MTRRSQPIDFPSTEECLEACLLCASSNSRRTARKVTRFYDHYMKPTGVSAAQFPILAAITAGAGHGLGRLAEAVDLDRSTLSRNLAILRDKGLIQMEQSAGPNPAQIRLTEAGKAQFADAHRAWLQAHDHLTARVGDAALKRFVIGLRFINSLDLLPDS